MYFSDPEGNRVELFVQTPWYMPPVSVPLDLALSDDEIYAMTEAMVERTPGHMKRADWSGAPGVNRTLMYRAIAGNYSIT